MRVNRGKLNIIMLTHFKVNIKADGQVLKYRYVSVSAEKSAWTCNGEVIEGMTTTVVNSIFEKYS